MAEQDEGWTVETLRQHLLALTGEREKAVLKLESCLLERLGAMEKINEERNKRYDERAALSDKAITKAEEAQKQYNQTHNDLTRKMDDQYGVMLPRKEADGKFEAIEDKISEIRKAVADLREHKSSGEGRAGISTQLQMVLASIAGGLAMYVVQSLAK